MRCGGTGGTDWEGGMDGQARLWDVEAENYDAFTEKFKTKLTTDDCYTPEPVYEAVAACDVKGHIFYFRFGRLGKASC